MSERIEPPDFELMFTLASEIGKLTKEKILLDIKIKFEEGNTINTVMTDPAYLQNGKQPSMAFIESTFKFAGIANSIIPLREEMANVTSRLEHTKLTFEIMKMQFDYYRTESANVRGLTQ